MTNNLCRFTHALKRVTLTRDIHSRTRLSTNLGRSYSSALFISGRMANKVFAFLTPYLDVDRRFADMDKLQKELALRDIKTDVVGLKNSWDFYRKMDADMCALEDNEARLSQLMKQVYESAEITPEQRKQETLKLRTQQKFVREDIKTMKHAIWDLDETVIENILKLPNELDPRTPARESVVLRSVGSQPRSSETSGRQRSHLDIGTDLGLLEYDNPIHCYLCDEAALFELAVLAYAGRVLGDDNGMVRISGADFSRSLVVEGSGLNHEDPATAFLLQNHEEVERGSSNRMHLVGGASLASCLILHTKQLINPDNFPLKYLATGRQYTPLPRDVQPCGLFTACQASVAHAFVMTKDSGEYSSLFDELVENVCRLYDGLCDHYRVVARSAPELQPWEGLRVSFELWSPFANRYIEVGHVSASGDYFSKRLLIAYQTPTGREFPAAISGTVVSVPRLLACLLEQNPDKFVIPPKVAEFMPTNDYC